MYVKFKMDILEEINLKFNIIHDKKKNEKFKI